MLAILECVQLCLAREYDNDQIIIISDSQVLVKFVSSHEYLSLFLWECCQTLIKLLNSKPGCVECLIMKDQEG